MIKRIAAVLGAMILAVSLSACSDDTECEGSGSLGDVTIMSMAERPSGGTSGGSRSGSSGGSGSRTGGKVGSSGGSTGGKVGKAKDHKPGGSKKVKVDDDLFEECND